LQDGFEEDDIISYPNPVGHFPFPLLRCGSKGIERE